MAVLPQVPGEWGWLGPAAALRWDYNADPQAHNYAIAIARYRQRYPEAPYERAVQEAQLEIGRRVSMQPEPENERNAAWAQTPLTSLLPEREALEQVIAKTQSAAPPAAQGADGQWRRMAGRYGLPALAALGAFAALAVVSGAPEPKAPQVMEAA